MPRTGRDAASTAAFGWDKNLIGTGLRTLEGPELAGIARDADILRPLHLLDECTTTVELAGRLRDALSHHFGADQVFRDIDRINPGERFPRVIEQEVGSCQALLAVIGSTWLSIKDDAGQRRLDNPGDLAARLDTPPLIDRVDGELVGY